MTQPARPLVMGIVNVTPDSFSDGGLALAPDAALARAQAMVAAGALVTPGKRVPSGQLWGGAPARYMRDLTEEEKVYIPYSAQHYVELAARYL